MKINFAICDDNRIDSQHVNELIKKWTRNKKYQIHIDIFQSAEAFLFHYTQNKEYDILLLDIEMKKMDGVTLARMIRKSNKSVQILFITGYSQYIAEGYDVEALHYLMKPIKEEKMFDVLDRAVTKLIQNEKHLLLKLSDEMIKIPLHEIIYIDVNRNYVTIHANKDYTLKKTLGEIEKELDEKFFRIGRSAIVNLKYITRITKTEVFLSNGFSLPLPRGIYDALNRAIINEI
ncbi:MAG TPA: response regulator transcription factor [Candidatus Caccosoma faecigallinarum]|uniref:Response regulator transcription factor n=1 Tax=Candidatus Caccosoma faecigallinarum TaxID=2840720 RepID=A0A9D1KBM1_9FIRM|nr:response regulator transcription factor [Candidatus Caccosoma faecigallinarum]